MFICLLGPDDIIAGTKKSAPQNGDGSRLTTNNDNDASNNELVGDTGTVNDVSNDELVGDTGTVNNASFEANEVDLKFTVAEELKYQQRYECT